MGIDWVYVGMYFSCIVITFLPAQLLANYICSWLLGGKFGNIKMRIAARCGVQALLWLTLFKLLWEFVGKI